LATLELVARAGGQAANADDYEAFLRLGDDHRRALIDAVVVLDQAPGLADVTPTSSGSWAGACAHGSASRWPSACSSGGIGA
jgi:hypothetical protein